MMRVLVACEYSGMVRDAFIRAGHEAVSCDLLPSESVLGKHYQGDVRDILNDGWDMVIAHIPCTFFTLAGARWFGDYRYPNREADREEMWKLWKAVKDAPIKRKCFENPQPMQWLMDRAGRYTQKLQPWQFGDNETKGICLWLDGLPPLIPTHPTKPDKVAARVWRMPPGPNRQKERSRFFLGICNAMAKQWGEIARIGKVGA